MTVQVKAAECPAEEVTEKANRSHSEERSNEESLVFCELLNQEGSFASLWMTAFMFFFRSL